MLRLLEDAGGSDSKPDSFDAKDLLRLPWLPVLISAGALALVGILLFSYCCCWRRRMSKQRDGMYLHVVESGGSAVAVGPSGLSVTEAPDAGVPLPAHVLRSQLSWSCFSANSFRSSASTPNTSSLPLYDEFGDINIALINHYHKNKKLSTKQLVQLVVGSGPSTPQRSSSMAQSCHAGFSDVLPADASGHLEHPEIYPRLSTAGSLSPTELSRGHLMLTPSGRRSHSDDQNLAGSGQLNQTQELSAAAAASAPIVCCDKLWAATAGRTPTSRALLSRDHDKAARFEGISIPSSKAADSPAEPEARFVPTKACMCSLDHYLISREQHAAACESSGSSSTTAGSHTTETPDFVRTACTLEMSGSKDSSARLRGHQRSRSAQEHVSWTFPGNLESALPPSRLHSTRSLGPEALHHIEHDSLDASCAHACSGVPSSSGVEDQERSLPDCGRCDTPADGQLQRRPSEAREAATPAHCRPAVGDALLCHNADRSPHSSLPALTDADDWDAQYLPNPLYDERRASSNALPSSQL